MPDLTANSVSTLDDLLESSEAYLGFLESVGSQTVASTDQKKKIIKLGISTLRGEISVIKQPTVFGLLDDRKILEYSVGVRSARLVHFFQVYRVINSSHHPLFFQLWEQECMLYFKDLNRYKLLYVDSKTASLVDKEVIESYQLFIKGITSIWQEVSNEKKKQVLEDGEIVFLRISLLLDNVSLKNLDTDINSVEYSIMEVPIFLHHISNLDDVSELKDDLFGTFVDLIKLNNLVLRD